MKPLGIYVHFPFCLRKCNYCNFYSLPYSEEKASLYIDELLREIEESDSDGFDVKTLYFGGGTPSALPTVLLEKVAYAIHKKFHCSIEEFTVEVNPITGGNIADYSAFGVNRISVGVQSLDDDLLKTLGRLHDSTQALDTLKRASEICGNVSADLIIGVSPKANVRSDIERISPYVKHFSVYMLKVENGTKLATLETNGGFSQLSDDEMTVAYDTAYGCLQENGFARYEVSNFCRQGFESRHNCGYWSMRDYLGFGPAAYSYVNGQRFHNAPSLKTYLAGGKGKSKQVLDETDEYTETIMLALRTSFGLNISQLNERFNIDFEKKYEKKLKLLKDFINLENGILRILPEKLLLENSIISELLY